MKTAATAAAVSLAVAHTPTPISAADDVSTFSNGSLARDARLCQPSIIGAANKAVIYQWESGKPTPSIVFWKRIEELARTYARSL